ncbi:alpha/beta hydrolase family protein [Flavobacterium hibernum]|uniref:Alpha/beta hydrolase n=1 Tax=Flavobacterium hibernum TaxID=37752 RepID=A0A0D0EWM8_9FLAO|nr:alpha/beta fold hydrolase [Flavobacterium hibernum]KIO53368.1 esterase [Flavobacterium hibernum]OXA87968.1 alpha/beta hydrolase [Flavobacterium hibernum]STO10559.1 Predicted dienelactone hydrolase [Flavobacterium hibernum]
MTKILSQLLICLLLISCSNSKKTNSQISNNTYPVKLDTLELFDKSRNRKVPIAIFYPKTDFKISNQQIIIFSHGYGENKGGDNMIYSYLTENLASKGYFVISIQHELPTDDLLAMEGDFKVTRKPNWERGTDNILYVLNEYKIIKPELDFKHLTLIGHSNGGDMTALFATKYPKLVYKIITMDNRRMPLPRFNQPKVYTLRSKNYSADEGVLPTEQEQKKYEMIVQLTPINHSDMDNDATIEERKIINTYIEKYLRE